MMLMHLAITKYLRVLQLQPILCLSLSYFDLTCIHFVYFDNQEATVVLDITTQFVASDGNKYSETT